MCSYSNQTIPLKTFEVWFEADIRVQVEDMENGDHKITLSADEYQMFLANQCQKKETLDFKVTLTQG